MPRPRVIVMRRKAVRNIHKITRTMQLIATSKFQRALRRSANSRPYAERIAALVRRMTRLTGEPIAHPLIEQRPVRTSLLLVLTSNRGLCGGYNAAVLRAALAHMRGQQDANAQVRLEVVGKKGINYLRFLGLSIEQAYTHIEDRPTFAQVEELGNRYIELFGIQRAVDEVHVAYTKFISAGSQRPVVERLLPMLDIEQADEKSPPSPAAAAGSRPLGQYQISPPPPQLLGALLPVAVRVRLFQWFNDAAVSEQVARMTAMRAATENAEEMIRDLTQQYNRARQSMITKELSEIIGGAEALS